MGKILSNEFAAHWCNNMIVELTCICQDLGIFVDHANQASKLKGYASLSTFNGVILVDNKMTPIIKLFVLLHEMGHVLKITHKNPILQLDVRKHVASEEEANKTACYLIGVMTDLDVEGRLRLMRLYARNYNFYNADAILNNDRTRFDYSHNKMEKFCLKNA